MPEIPQSPRTQQLLNRTYEFCKSMRHEFIMPEHLLSSLLEKFEFCDVLYDFAPAEELRIQLAVFLEHTEQVPEGKEYEPESSVQMGQLLTVAIRQVHSSSATQLDVPHLVAGLLSLDDSWASYLLHQTLNGQEAPFISNLITAYEAEDNSPYDEDDSLYDTSEERQQEHWKDMVTCLNDTVEQHNPLVGRETELQRTMQVLCRKDKNNPLHVGDPGVGKTALVYGLAARINSGDVPQRLIGSHIYQLDLASMLAGTQFRGDFEKRIKAVIEGAQQEEGAIIYIDEIHNLVGAGATGDGSMDASNILKPYLEQGNLRFIGSTTHEEYKRYFERSRGLVRRFQEIDIDEPTEEEAIHILQQLQPRYEEFHKVCYTDDAIDFAVHASAKHISDRRLPDKAIDLIDEAGAAAEMARNRQENADSPQKTTTITLADIADVLAKTAKVEALAIHEDDTERLSTLEERLRQQIYGQDEAIRQVTEAVQMAKAGLEDDQKPMASLLFVGPTGVGKTEVARVLAHELGIELVRFDMSEYTEKHTVAKLIGSPAGYVGYEDGGLLTDAIRRTPNCVLLLDEIEKAHQDIYNILLQVMDYARLTDNKGRKADFRNVILIMTSNAGAQFSRAQIGFEPHTSAGEAMLKQVRKTFKPEFINRLSSTVVFRDMDRQMAALILDKKLRQLQEKLTAKNVTMTLSEATRERLLNEGFTREFGAREMDRVIARRLKPVLTREILFGSLRNGGHIEL